MEKIKEWKGKSQCMIAVMKYALNAFVNLPAESKKGHCSHWVPELET